jgi:hypothetical protein
MNDMCVQIGLAQHVPQQTVRIYVKTGEIALRLMDVHVHLDGETNILSKKDSM